jgi:hypothetical protein
MRVESTSPGTAQNVRRKAESSATGFKVDAGQGSGHAEKVVESQPLASLDTLVTLQEVPDRKAGRKRAIKRAGDMLDGLEAIRLDLLTGDIPTERLSALLRLVRAQRDQIDDPRLSYLLDEIELRARVELAKLGQAC